MVTLGDVQAFADELERQELATSSRVRTLAAVKSLFSFAQRTGYLPLNVGAALKLQPRKDTLAERILTETDVLRLLALEPSPRNRAILRLLYAGGLRVSELCALVWKDLQPRKDTGQVTLFGKGGKTRTVLLPVSIWQELVELRHGASPRDPVFRSRNGGHLDPVSIERLVLKAAQRAGIEGNVATLAPPRARDARARSRRADPPGTSDTRPLVGGHHRSPPARPADGLERAISRLSRENATCRSGNTT